MRYLGIDYGKSNIGLAVSDDNGKIAFPYETVKNNRQIFAEIKKICDNENINKIIVGLPIGLGGGETKQTEEVKKFADILKQILGGKMKVIFENEFFSTAQAERFLKESGAKNIKSKSDVGAAVIILQSYLDKIKN